MDTSIASSLNVACSSTLQGLVNVHAVGELLVVTVGDLLLRALSPAPPPGEQRGRSS